MAPGVRSDAICGAFVRLAVGAIKSRDTTDPPYAVALFVRCASCVIVEVWRSPPPPCIDRLAPPHLLRFARHLRSSSSSCHPLSSFACAAAMRLALVPVIASLSLAAVSQLVVQQQPPPSRPPPIALDAADTPDDQQRPLAMAPAPLPPPPPPPAGPAVPVQPGGGSDATAPPPETGTIILSDVLGRDRSINVFAGFTRDFAPITHRFDDATQNSTVLAPLNSAIEALPRKPWEDPRDYHVLGADAYEGPGGRERAQKNLRRFVEAHIVPVSPWPANHRASAMAGDDKVWWETKADGKRYVGSGPPPDEQRPKPQTPRTRVRSTDRPRSSPATSRSPAWPAPSPTARWYVAVSPGRRARLVCLRPLSSPSCPLC